MGTIAERRLKDGTTVYTAQIRIMRDGVKTSASSTFERRPAAEAWLRRKESEASKPGGFEKVARKRQSGHTLGDAIDKYIAESEREIGKTKSQVLAAIKLYDIASLPCGAIKSADVVSFARELLDGGRQPQTVANYVSHMAAIFAVAGPMWGMPLDVAEMKAAHVVMRRMGITAKSSKRDRRPTLAEMNALMQHFADKHAHGRSLPMHKVTAFALFSTRRQEEITRIRWEDFEPEHNRIMVRDMKHPGQKIGNNTWCELPYEAIQIIESMPKTKPEIFPYSTDAITASFTRACKLLGIRDLHFHDLRHEGVSRLLEMGRTIPQVAPVSGHRSWVSLQRYSHLREVGDKWKGWPWLAKLTASAGGAEIIPIRVAR